MTFFIADILYAAFFVIGIVIGCCCSDKCLDLLYSLLAVVYALYNLIATIVSQVRFSDTSCYELINTGDYNNIMILNRIFGYILPGLLIIFIIKAAVEYKNESNDNPEGEHVFMARYGIFQRTTTVTYTRKITYAATTDDSAPQAQYTGVYDNNNNNNNNNSLYP